MASDVGIPDRGALSPLLGNLLLDHFDERSKTERGRLVRYADDFLILTDVARMPIGCTARARARRPISCSSSMPTRP